MEQKIDLSKIEKKAYMAFHKDGLWDLLIGLMQKHRVRDMEELVALRDQYEKQIEDLTFSDEKIKQLVGKYISRNF